MDHLSSLRSELQALGSVDKAQSAARFFKTAEGQYGAGDIFIGVTRPELRKLAHQYDYLQLADIEQLIVSAFHEERSVALIILVHQFSHGDKVLQKTIYEFYIKHAPDINNWDLVDGSAEYIVGPWLENKDKSILVELANSRNIWERRIAMLATFHYIKQGDSTEALKIIELLLHDQHDLIQKAVGWMLREIGKRCGEGIEEKFLELHYKTMPRTALRYAIERFSEERRQHYLKRV